MLGIKCRVPERRGRRRGARRGAAARAGGDNVVRLLPPLIVGEAEIEEAMRRLDAALAGADAAAPPPSDGGRMGTPRHFLDLSELPAGDAARHPRRQPAAEGGRQRRRGERPLEGRVLAMIFDKPSTRTRVSFDVAMRQLGGETIMLTGTEMQLGRGETIADTARVLSRYVDAIMIRILDHEALLELAEHATVPVINGLTRRSHPCQIMADVMTFEEHRGPVAGRKVAWTGDVNNVLASLVHAAQRFAFRLDVAAPPELRRHRTLSQLDRGERRRRCAS